MKSRKIKLDETASQEVLEELGKDHPPHVYKRLMALKMRAIDGLNSKEAGRLSGLHSSTVDKLLVRYQEQGIECLVTKRHNHGNRYMTREEEIAFLQAFYEQAESGRVIEVHDIHVAYQKAVGHPVTKSAIYYLLHKHGWRKVMPRGKHPKKAGEAEIQDYQKNLVKNTPSQEASCQNSGDVSGRGWLWTDQ